MIRKTTDSVMAELRAIRARFSHVPVVSIALMLAIVVVAARSEVWDHEPSMITTFQYGFSGRGLISMHRWQPLLSSIFMTRNIFMVVSLTASLAATLVVYERIAGSIRAAIVAIVAGIGGLAASAGVLWLASRAGSDLADRTLSTFDFGASTIVAGAAGALVGVMRRTRLTWFVILWLAVGAILHHQLADLMHIVAFTLCAPVGMLLSVSRRARLNVGDPRRRAITKNLVRVVSVVVFSVLIASTVPVSTAAVSLSRVRTSAPIGNRNHEPVVPDPGASTLSTAGKPKPAVPLSPARVESLSYPTPSLGGKRKVIVYLPAGYDESTERYPVVELLHGVPGQPEDVLVGLGLPTVAASPDLRAFIAVSPDGHGPVVPDSEFADTSRQRVGTAVSTDLQAWVNTTFRTDRVWTVAGVSSGGFGAAYLANRPDSRYVAACPMSGTFRPGGAAFQRESPVVVDAASPIKLVRPGGPAEYLVVGKNDAAGVQDAQEFGRQLYANKIVWELHVGAGGHDWELWRSSLPGCLKFLLSFDLLDAGVHVTR